MRRKRKILYDYECYRILAQDLLLLESPNKDWPKVKYGTVTTATEQNPGNKLEVHYSVEFTSSQTAKVEFRFYDPFLQGQQEQSLNLIIGHKTGRIKWRFECPMQTSKWCQRIRPSLWLGKFGWACQECGKIKRYSKVIEDQLIRYRKDPPLITSILISPLATERQKRFAFIALEKLSNRFKKMTNNYENLTPQERNYYKKLRSLLFSNHHHFKPSEKLKDAPLPFHGKY